jgi:hypothetical protein
MKIEIFGAFIYFYGFSTQFPNIISKASRLCSEIFLGQVDSKFVDPILQGVKNAFFFTSNAIILQSMCSTF